MTIILLVFTINCLGPFTETEFHLTQWTTHQIMLFILFMKNNNHLFIE